MEEGQIMLTTALEFLAFMVKHPEHNFEYVIEVWDGLPPDEKEACRDALNTIDAMSEIDVSLN
jgi:hypothetical protein